MFYYNKKYILLAEHVVSVCVSGCMARDYQGRGPGDDLHASAAQGYKPAPESEKHQRRRRRVKVEGIP